MPLLEVRELSVGIKKSAAPLVAVDRLSFDIEAGEIVGLAGESGCGKTLTALSIARLLSPPAGITGGTVRFNPELPGKEPLTLSALDERELRRIRGKEIALIFQEPRQSLNPLLRTGDQIVEALELHGVKDKRERRAAALDMMGKLGLPEPEKLYRAFPHQLSGGMCQRVMIAMAAICRPRLLIADEPVTALDAAVQAQILTLLGEINRDFGTAILCISHDLSVVRRFCSRFLVMYAGKILEEGPAETLFSAPAHPYTRGLIGAIPGKERRGKALAHIPGRVPSIEDPRSGCPFAPRCGEVRDRCRTAFPGETDLGGGHRLRCFAARGDHA